jgi:glutamate synthase domain-containing protein 1
MTSHNKQPPKAVGLYDPRFEHDACGVGMVARLDNQPTHEVVARALTALENLEHRGATGADPCTGDGAGILMQLPDELLRAMVNFELPPAGEYGVLMCFLPTEDDVRAGVAQAGDQDAFERKLYVIRRISDLTAEEPGLYVTSSSSRTINYKGMLISYQLGQFYKDLSDERCKSALALVHSRFSTNTFPSWELAHPYRVICHNGEINTVMGNVNWMRARESELRSELFGDDLEKILPVVTAGNSDSATFDNVLELLMLAGRSLTHAAMMMIPEAYRNRDDLPDYLKGFYAYHSCLMEPWDGPASVAFTDGRVVGATLDRNGLRPGRWVETTDGYVVLGSLVAGGLSTLLSAGFVRIFLIHTVTWSVTRPATTFATGDPTATTRPPTCPGWPSRRSARRGTTTSSSSWPPNVHSRTNSTPPTAEPRGLERARSRWEIVRVLPERKRATRARGAST